VVGVGLQAAGERAAVGGHAKEGGRIGCGKDMGGTEKVINKR
jgi:hypothetical protein